MRARAREAYQAGLRAAGRVRRRAAERLGWDRWSHPALHGMDRKLAEYLPHRGGVFIEAGAFDGYWQSNTYWFERCRGWSGVLVEPIPEYYRRCCRERPGSQVFNCALVAPQREGETVTMVHGDVMSVMAGARGAPDADEAHAATARSAVVGAASGYRVEVPGRTLSGVLDEAGVTSVDLLSLDVEGAEAEVLRGLDLERHRPRFLLVEMLDEAAVRPGIEAVVGGRYEEVDRPSPLDVLYRARA